MKKFIFTLIVTAAVVGGAVAFRTPYSESAKANAATGMDPLSIMSRAVGLPVAHYDDYSVVFN
jgi:hypothetical protein